MAAPCGRPVLAHFIQLVRTDSSLFSVSVRYRHVKTRNPIKRVKPLAIVDTASKKDEPQNISALPFGEADDVYDEEEHDSVLDRADEFYDLHQSELRERRRKAAKYATLRKYFRQPPETNLLTWAAKQQILYLHGLDPVEWNPKRIAECFPISESGAKKFLKTQFRLVTPEEIKQHDSCVASRWKALREGKSLDGISPITQRLYEEGKLKADNAYGNPSLPSPPDRAECKKVQPLAHQIKPGEYTKLISKYLEIKNKTSSSQEVEKVETSPIVDEHYDDPEAATRYTHHKNSPHVTFDTFKRDIMQNIKDGADEEWDRWLKEQQATKAITEKSKDKTEVRITKAEDDDYLDLDDHVPKYKDDSVEVVCEGSDGSAPSCFEEKSGYWSPLGQESLPKQWIRIPNQLKEKGKLYKVGRCYYDCDGELLYRVP